MPRTRTLPGSRRGQWDLAVLARHVPIWRVAGVVAAVVLVVAAAGCASSSGDPSAGDLAASTSVATGQPLAPTLGGRKLGGRQDGDLTVWLYSSSSPPARGNNTLEAVLADAAGQPITNATVSFNADMTNMSMGRYVVPASSIGDGHFRAVVTFRMGGPWRLIVSVQRAGTSAAVRFDFTVT